VGRDFEEPQVTIVRVKRSRQKERPTVVGMALGDLLARSPRGDQTSNTRLTLEAHMRPATGVADFC
jgi:hypothetical protein